jgi:hypothetical protein
MMNEIGESRRYFEVEVEVKVEVKAEVEVEVRNDPKRKNFDTLCHTPSVRLNSRRNPPNPHFFSTFQLLNFSPNLRLRLRKVRQ